MMKPIYSISAVLLVLSLSGCSNGWYPFVYRPPVSQGNVMDTSTTAQLKIGMTKAQVINLIGEPVLDTPLSPDVWHYVYTLREKGRLIEHKQMTLYFRGDTLVQIKPLA